MPVIEFANEFVPQNLIDIPQLGNFALEAIDEENGFYYYFLMKTSLGTSVVFNFGPIIPDFDNLPDTYNVTYQKLSFNDKKMKLFVSKWLNDSKKKITAANLITQEELYRDLKPYILNCDGEVQ